MAQTTIVVPCFNERHRLNVDDFATLVAEGPHVLGPASGRHVLFVDDGSTDDTVSLLRRAAAEHPSMTFLRLEKNQGKAEAVRQGMLAAIAKGADVVGYLDSDGATAPAEMLRLQAALADPNIHVVLGSRIQMLGTHIARNPLRHYVGRVLATGASLALRLPVYDTQCGAKLFRVGRPLQRALAEPFASSWVFDVELIQRLLLGVGGECLPPQSFIEVPLLAWRDVPGSKVRPGAVLRAAFDLARIALAHEPRRRSS